MEREGWRVQTLRSGKVFIKNLPLAGAVIKIQRPPAIPTEEELDTLARDYHALFIKVEPDNLQPVAATGYLRADKWPLLPSKTLRLNLRVGKEALWKNLDPDAKYSIRKAQKSLSVGYYPAGNDMTRLRQFYRLLKNTGGRKGFYTPRWKNLQTKVTCFKKKAWLILAEEGGRAVAGCLLFFHDGVCYYHHAASSKRGRQLLAAYLVCWKAIKLARKLGYHTFDFEGIYDPRFPKATRSWKGFTYFKKKFGGEEVEFPRPLIRYYSLAVKWLFTLFG